MRPGSCPSRRSSTCSWPTCGAWAPISTSALAAARQCERGATQISAHRIEAMAICLQALVAGIQGDGRGGRERGRSAPRAIMPGRPRGARHDLGQIRVAGGAVPRRRRPRRQGQRHGACRIWSEALQRRRSRVRGFYSPPQAPLIARGPGAAACTRCCRPSAAATSARCDHAWPRRSAQPSSWNRGCLAYAEAVLEGRAGHAERATALADRGQRVCFAPFAPWWNHLARRLVAPAALADGWGEPVAWMREAAAGFEATGPRPARLGVPRHPAQGRRASAAVRPRRRPRCPPQMRRLGVTSREMDVYLLVAQGCSNAEIASPAVHLAEDGRDACGQPRREDRPGRAARTRRACCPVRPS